MKGVEDVDATTPSIEQVIKRLWDEDFYTEIQNNFKVKFFEPHWKKKQHIALLLSA